MEIIVTRVRVLDGTDIRGVNVLKAFVDICIDDCLIIKGFRVVKGKDGLFVSCPQEQKDDRWYETVMPLTRELRDRLEALILVEYAKVPNIACDEPLKQENGK